MNRKNAKLNLQRLSPTEVDVMRQLWTLAPVCVPDLLEALNGRRSGEPVQRGTLHVLLGRLEEKGWVQREKEGRGFLYRSTVSEDEGRLRLASEFNERVFDGSPTELVQTLVRGKGLNRSEIAGLRELLDQAERNFPNQDKTKGGAKS